MPLINHTKKEINAKIVYAGPSSAGKASNLNYIYSKLKEESRGTFKSMNLQDDRMLFFEFTPPAKGNFEGYTIRFHIYTLTGEMHRTSSLKMMLKGADGVMFIADSSRDGMAANLEACKSLQESLAAYGKTLNDLPCVVQFNKQDLTERYRPDEIARVLNLGEYPSFSAVATTGKGVLESIFALVKLVLQEVRGSGIKLEGQPEEFQQLTETQSEVSSSAAAATDGGEAAREPEGMALSNLTGATTVSADEPPAIAGHEPVIEIAGGAELSEGGVIRLPLSISCGGIKKRITLAISLTAD